MSTDRAGLPLTLFEAILYQWLERHAFALEARERMTDVAFLSLRSEDLFADPAAAVETVARFAGLDPPGPTAHGSARRNESWARSLESRPLSEEWRVYGGHPAHRARDGSAIHGPRLARARDGALPAPAGAPSLAPPSHGVLGTTRARRALAPTERHRAARCRRSRGPAATTAFRGAPRSSVPPAGAMTRRPPGGGGGAADVRGTTGRRRIDRRRSAVPRSDTVHRGSRIHRRSVGRRKAAAPKSGAAMARRAALGERLARRLGGDPRGRSSRSLRRLPFRVASRLACRRRCVLAKLRISIAHFCWIPSMLSNRRMRA